MAFPSYGGLPRLELGLGHSEPAALLNPVPGNPELLEVFAFRGEGAATRDFISGYQLGSLLSNPEGRGDFLKLVFFLFFFPLPSPFPPFLFCLPRPIFPHQDTVYASFLISAQLPGGDSPRAVRAPGAEGPWLSASPAGRRHARRGAPATRGH